MRFSLSLDVPAVFDSPNTVQNSKVSFEIQGSLLTVNL